MFVEIIEFLKMVFEKIFVRILGEQDVEVGAISPLVDTILDLKRSHELVSTPSVRLLRKNRQWKDLPQ